VIAAVDPKSGIGTISLIDAATTISPKPGVPAAAWRVGYRISAESALRLRILTYSVRIHFSSLKQISCHSASSWNVSRLPAKAPTRA
jgi:hypothetical protein